MFEQRKRRFPKDKPDFKGKKKFSRFTGRQKSTTRFQIPKDVQVDYKNIGLLQRYLTDRGKIFARRLSGVNAREQRQLASAIKKARFLALLPMGGVRK